jgi:hypothetical protein
VTGVLAALVNIVLVSTAFGQRGDYEQAPIRYFETEVHDAVAQLAERLERGKTQLEHRGAEGYLRSVLKELDVPVSSQTLVFSKTSLQLHRISPRRPRAIYFNDDVYVGYCQHGDVLELAATDAHQGATFYTLDQTASERPKLLRDRGECLSCHASSRTQNVPGYLVRSVFPDAVGRPKLGSGTYTIDHTSPFRERWGGWYVTGTHGQMRHMGNTISRGDEHEFDFDGGANVVELEGRFDTSYYPSPHSDLVALMVLEHQTQMHNAIAAANYETRQALHQSFEMNRLLERPKGFVSELAERRISGVVENVVEHLLMCGEFELTSPVQGTSGFAEGFARRGPTDYQGRSLRHFDLEQRLFRYPCSYLIYSDAFDGLPKVARLRILQRLAEILRGEDESEMYSHLSATMRDELLEILRDTKPEFRSVLK